MVQKLCESLDTIKAKPIVQSSLIVNQQKQEDIDDDNETERKKQRLKRSKTVVKPVEVQDRIVVSHHFKSIIKKIETFIEKAHISEEAAESYIEVIAKDPNVQCINCMN